MQAYIIKRVIAILPVLFIVGGVAFLLLQLTPGDPAVVLAGPDATSEDIERIRTRMGLDEPVLTQLVTWYANALRGDLGRSIYFGQPVITMLLQRVEPTLLLTLLAMSLAVVIGVPMGVLAAIRQNTRVDYVVMTLAIVGISIPAFWKLLMLILIFSVWYRIFPVAGYVYLSEDVWQCIRHLILPAISIGIASCALIARMSRSSMLDVLREDYIRTARSKGLAERTVVFRHALKNAMIPIITVIGLSVAILLGGAVVSETIATIPGMGSLVVQSVMRRDYPMLQGLLVTIAGSYAIVNLIVDLIYGYLDPRVRYE